MLFASLVCSGIILAAALLAARYAGHPVRAAVWWAVGVAAGSVFVGFLFPAVVYQAAIACGGLLLAGRSVTRGGWSCRSPSPRLWPPTRSWPPPCRRTRGE